MAYEQKDMSGSLFVNNRKEKETHPDRTGTALIDGVSYYVNGWIKDSITGKWLSLSFKRKDEAAKPAKEAAGIPDAPIHDDDIPF
jgi:hypothetical protein